MFRPALKKISELGEPASSELLSALEKASPNVNDRRLVKSLSVPSISSDDLREIVSAIGALYLVQVRDEVPLERLIEDVGNAMARDLPEPLCESLKARLGPLLNVKPMAVSVKASDLQKQHTRVFLGARILTDIRPVFEEGKEPFLSGAMLVHNLKLEVAENLESKDIYVALDDDDIVTLQKVLARATVKSKVLKSALREARIIDLESNGENASTRED